MHGNLASCDRAVDLARQRQKELLSNGGSKGAVRARVTHASVLFTLSLGGHRDAAITT